MSSNSQITARAYQIAHSGRCFGWLAVQHELLAEGYSRASHLLDDGLIREQLNRICAEARKGTYRDV